MFRSKPSQQVVVAGLATALAAFLIWPHPAESQTPQSFYKGKVVSLLIGWGPGGSNDAWARVIALHLGKHIPGAPTVAPQNMPGAGSLKLANYIYNVASKDGLTIGVISRGVPIEPLLGGKGIQFDSMKFNYIGSPDRDTTVCASRKDAKIQQAQELFVSELSVGASGSGADSAIYPEFLAEFLKMKFKVVKGYPGSNDQFLAMERNEVQGLCVAYDSLTRQSMFKEGKLNVLFQAALTRGANIPTDVPLVTQIVDNPQSLGPLRFFLARAMLGRPIVAPPGVLDERVDALRHAFDSTMQDPDFQADAAKQGLSVDPISGADLVEALREINTTPASTIRQVADILGRTENK